MSKTLADFTKEDLAEMIRVEQEENTRLKELNREMVGMLKDVLYYPLPFDVHETISEMIAKAEGENTGE